MTDAYLMIRACALGQACDRKSPVRYHDTTQAGPNWDYRPDTPTPSDTGRSDAIPLGSNQTVLDEELAT